jgi:general secretion pathway protein E
MVQEQEKPAEEMLAREVAGVDPRNPDAAVILADRLIRRALDLRASDLHFHPQANALSVRIRVDGVLHPAARIPAELRELIITRLKVMAKLVVYQRQLPQDGRIHWTPETPGIAAPAGEPVLLRVSFLPTLHGEDVVVRLPEGASAALELSSLGMAETTLRRLDRLLDLEQGVVLLTGPSGCGKTTTIYAMLRAIHQRRGNAAHTLTLEDPIEQDLAFAGQVSIRTDQGLGWTTALRSVLRQDPNVILIGEIRDRETAEIAIQAGLTGHLVISTVHSGRCVGVLVRMVQMDIEPFLVASAITATLAQRLVRRLCPACRRHTPAPREAVVHFGLAEDEVLWSAPGCPECGGTGGRGRIGIFELLVLDTAVRERVMRRASESELQAAAFGARDALLADALEKARAGLIAADTLARLAVSALPENTPSS